MSKQCRFFLLPSDIERLLDQLRSKVSYKLISTRSDVLSPTELQSPFSEYVFPSSKKRIYADCYLIPSVGADIKMGQHLAKENKWTIDISSEAIEFSGCDYDGTQLRIGRFYIQTDLLIGNEIWPKRQEFLKWADRVFRTTKKLLTYSNTLFAYVGQDAAVWERNGGTFKHS